jgi:hypothetical protein
MIDVTRTRAACGQAVVSDEFSIPGLTADAFESTLVGAGGTCGSRDTNHTGELSVNCVLRANAMAATASGREPTRVGARGR